MAFTIPDAGEGDSNIQSILFQEYIDVLVAGIQEIDCVLNGLAVTGGADMTPAVAKGGVLSNGTMFAVAAADVTIGTADGTNPRIDLIVVNSSGALAVRAGTAAAAPKPPAKTANDVVIAAVYVPAGDTAIGTSQITDMRVCRDRGVVLKKTHVGVAQNNSTSALTLFTATIPNGLFLAGRQMRLRLGGTMLINSGAPTIRLIVSYGGTTMFSDISGAATADADRNSWDLELTLTAQANNDQSLNGFAALGIIAAKTAPTTGIGDAWSTAANINSINGAAAVDSDAGNRDLVVTLTFSVANAANEVVTEYSILELL